MTTALEEELKKHLRQLCELRDKLENDILEQVSVLENDDLFHKYIKSLTHIQDCIFHLRDTIIAYRKM